MQLWAGVVFLRLRITVLRYTSAVYCIKLLCTVMTMINGASENIFQVSCLSSLLFQQLWSFFLRHWVKVVYVQTEIVYTEEHF